MLSSVCGELMALRGQEPLHPALARYAEVGRLMTGNDLTDVDAHTALVELLEDWTLRLGLPRLGTFGVVEADVARIVANSRGSSMKTNPIVLADEEIAGLVRARF